MTVYRLLWVVECRPTRLHLENFFGLFSTMEGVTSFCERYPLPPRGYHGPLCEYRWEVRVEEVDALLHVDATDEEWWELFKECVCD